MLFRDQSSQEKLPALLHGLTGKLKSVKDWFGQSAMLHLHFTLSHHLSCEVARFRTDALEYLELSALRQALWINGENRSEKHHAAGNAIEWIDTGRQVADCLTKSMKTDYLVKVLAAEHINT